MRTQPDVSVVLLTYNHQRFIAQAVESVLAQEGVEFELLIAEDFSTDGTRAMVEEYARQHPNLVRLFLSPRNLNTNDVLSRPIEAARGRYVALLDGDDYWTSPTKLRAQVNYLDAHAECAMCFHNTTVEYEDGSPSHLFHLPVPSKRISHALPAPVSTLADVAPGNFMQTCSVMFRRGLFEFPQWYGGFVVGDWPLHVLNAEHGDIGYLDESMAVYRVHAGGLWSQGMSRYGRREWVDGLAAAYRTLDGHLKGRFAGEFRQRTAGLYLEAAIAAQKDGRTGDTLYYGRRYLAALSPGERLMPGPLFGSVVRSCRAGVGRWLGALRGTRTRGAR